MAETEGLVNGVESLSVNDTPHPESSDNVSGDEYHIKWGFSLEELYKIALKFYKEKEGKALQVTYKDKLRLVAYTKQVSFGKFRNDVSPDVGFLDVVGNDRRQAWQALGDMSKESAMEEFVKFLEGSCNLFKPFVEAHKAEKEEKLRQQQEEEERLRREEEERKQRELEEEARKQQEAEKQRQMEQEMQIRSALNQQTAAQFRQYAEQQYPGNTQMQEELIRQLQEQHFQQYMQQVYQQQLMHQQQQLQQMHTSNNNSSTTLPQPAVPQQLNSYPQQGMDLGHREGQALENGQTDSPEESIAPSLPHIMPASMWTRKDLKQFKESVGKCKENVIKIGSLATATVRVPTHEDGSCLFWEFATDYYDIGFGVYFEWTIAPSNTVSVHVSEDTDEEEFEEEEGGGEAADVKGDVEKGKKQDNRPPADEIIPIYRRDCHEEVYCGSHTYPGRGVYLLKFDNSYSLWRSKTLYYRVYYSR
ncbi:Golgi resident protein GCP60-like isoform X1 [Haliotis asinina]|uniref:Golgi resident protein GCP60-like isoform X1 n=1 Tax=Haliotis asinina TaxID=109174 RepID=UPI0035325FD0